MKNATIQWLISQDAAPLLSNTQNQLLDGEDILQVVRSLRKQISPEETAVVVELAQLRIRARKKFKFADRMFFTRRTLEMATDQRIAEFKAKRFCDMSNVADFCCGIGGDLIGLATPDAQRKLIAVDSDELTVAYANANLAAMGLPQLVQLGEFDQFCNAQFDAIHIDPERRKNGRATRGDHFSPSLDSIFGSSSVASSWAIKIAPATQCPDLDKRQIERHWIGHSKECKQQVLWLGALAKRPGSRTATVLTDAGTGEFHCGEEDLGKRGSEICGPLGAYVYEPHSVILAASLTDPIARSYGLVRIAADSVYLTGNDLVQDPLLGGFEIIEQLPLGISKVVDALDRLDVGQVEVKKRGIPDYIVERYKRLRLRGTQHVTLLLTRIGDRRIAIVAKRLAG